MLSELIDIIKFIIGFLPWILFLFLPTNSWDQLQRAVVICLVLSVISGYKALYKGFILQWATLAFFLFCLISFYAFNWVELAKRMGLIANGFLDGIIWFTVLTGKPFTLQYARAELPKERWNDEGLIRSCRTIAIFWGILLLIPTSFEVFRLSYPNALPHRFYFFQSIFCIAVGVCYTTIYKHIRRRQRQTLDLYRTV